MKILAINSSFRKHGNTERIFQLMDQSLLKIAKEKGKTLEIEYFSLGETNIEPCRGCRLCFEKGEDLCPMKDNLALVRSKLQEADAIILGSPVYVEDVNGLMKNLIDRMAFNCHRPAYYGKSALIFTTSGASSTKHALKTMRNALCTWGFYIAEEYRFRMGGPLVAEPDVIKKYSDKVNKLATVFFNSIDNYKPLHPTVYSYMIFKIQQTYWQKESSKRNKLDYEYWKTKGWLEPYCNYYIDHKCLPIKSKTARALGKIISKFFV
ncbi:flavodoxin family protein [Anaerocolumna sp. MB42-C2]|uniref:flavodoxin family protein n=1 Tax=Anaerocolumna sp. MB42-C2 TaxID=3070997 RepID=UPI0027DF54EF|nr:flavodoxin family protein [Anaerocolumna sp. MB42-C2]WMJ88338.1 flavodoxin family protein [Anaerocolumna sp. MB42-C2]